MITFARNRQSKFYVTTAIDYTNAPPHIGHAYEKIAADVQARWKRIKGDDVFFLTGTDEHGIKVQRAAKAANATPKKFVDDLARQFKQAWTALDLSFNKFIRTTDPAHERAIIELIKKVYKKGDIYKGHYEGLYCVGCERFLTERDLVDGKCPWHKKKPEYVKEESYFFKLSKYQKALLRLYKTKPTFISPPQKKTEVINRVKEGLKDLSITRTTFSWGIPFPYDKKHVIYVWFDALPNYITALGWPTGKDFKKYWPADVHHLGADVLWFHTVIWPAILMSAGIELPKKVFVHGWLTVDGQKMSKSLGNVLDPRELVKKYGADPIKYYILREIPFGENGDFSEESLVQRYNSDLANTLGNLLSRSLALVGMFSRGIVPKPNKQLKADVDLQKAAKKSIQGADKKIEQLEFHHALGEIWTFIAAENKYVDSQKPWVLAKENKERLNTVLYNLIEGLRIISILISSFMPSSADKIRKQIGVKKAPSFNDLKWGLIKPGTKVQKGKSLFPKIELSKLKRPKEEPFSQLDLRIARIKEVNEIPGADKLYALKIELGPLGQRQIVAGIKQHYAKKQLENKQIVVLANLEPARLRGVRSEGMLLAAVQKGQIGILTGKKSKPGDKVFVDGIKLKPAKKIKFADFEKVEMKTGLHSQVLYKKRVLKTQKEQILAEKVKAGAKIE